MLKGAMHVLAGSGNISFVESADDLNYVAVLSQIQQETGRDLGLCRYFSHNILQHLESNNEQSGLQVDQENVILTLDPSQCDAGYAGLWWSYGSVSIHVLGRYNDHCVFICTSEIEMGASSLLPIQIFK